MSKRPKIWRCVLSLFLMAGVCGCAGMNAPAQHKPKQSARFYKLLELNDLNERAFEYHQHCLKHDEPMNEQFMENFKATTDLLLDEAVGTMDMKPDVVVERVLARRQDIQTKLNYYYNSRGCHSPEGQTALQHYRTLSEPNKQDIADF